MNTNRVLCTSLLVLFFSTFLLHIKPTSAGALENTEFIRTTCYKITSNPNLCFSSLYDYATIINQNPYNLANQSVSLAIPSAKDSAQYFAMFYESYKREHYNNHRVSNALHRCEKFKKAVGKMYKSLDEMRSISSDKKSSSYDTPAKLMWDALGFENTCTVEFENVEDEAVKRDVMDRVNQVKGLTTIAFELVHHSFYTQKESTP
ncbi:hypothetical protein ACFE04_029429 [Oxalis oulophora]